jgi:polygalacturonase
VSDELRANIPPGAIRHYVGIIPSEVTDAINDLINDINAQIIALNGAIQALSGVGALGGDLSGTLPNPTIAAGVVTYPKMASGAAAVNVGSLGGDLTGTLPNPTVASAAVTSAKMASGAAATNVGSLGGDLTGTLPNPTIAAGAVTNTKMASGAASANIGSLGGVLGGTLPNPTFSGGQTFLSWFNVKNYGALGDGSTDDTTAINAAIAAANAAGITAIIYFPTGSYVITTTLTTITCNVYGDGPHSTFILPPVTLNTLTFSTAGTPVTIQGIYIKYSAPANSSVRAITIDCTGTYAVGSIIRDVSIYNAYYGVLFSNQAWGCLDNLQIIATGSIALQIQTPLSIDSGGHSIVNCQFWGVNTTTTTGIYWSSAGGIKIVNSKFGNLNYGIQIVLDSGAVTSQILVNNCSFDVVGTTGIRAARAGATGTLTHLLINNNVFNQTWKAVNIVHDATAAWVVNVMVVGNIYLGTATANGFFVALDSCYNIMVANNSCESSVATTTLYIVNAGVNTGVVGPNTKINTWGGNVNSGSAVTIIAPN